MGFKGVFYHSELAVEGIGHVYLVVAGGRYVELVLEQGLVPGEREVTDTPN